MTFNISTQLVDARNFNDLAPVIAEKLKTAAYVGFDIESTDNAHPALAAWRKANKKTVFDARRTIITGFSLYAKDDDVAYYINLNHADVENRVPWEEARKLLDIRPLWVIHNSPFERRMLKCVYDWDVGEAIDSLQLAVSAWGMDEYPQDRLDEIYKWPVVKLFPEIEKEFAAYEYGQELTTPQAELLAKVVGKASTAAWSYNGFADSIAYGYGLKRLAKTLLGIETATYKETLAKAGSEHMGQLTGEQVAQYGADDSWLCVKVMEKILTMIKPEALQAFIDTEDEAMKFYTSVAVEGCRVDKDKLYELIQSEEQLREQAMQQFKTACQAALPFPVEPNKELLKRESWYAKNWQKYRRMVSTWSRDDGKEFNPLHYMPARVIWYDLFGFKPVVDDGKVQSDGNARGKLLEKAEGHAHAALKACNEVASVAQRINLYYTPYTALIDPETSRVYPVVSSMLVTRRLAAENPNVSQLGKRGDAAIIRSLYLPDEPDYINEWRRTQIASVVAAHNNWTEVECWHEWLNQHPDYDPRHCLVSIDYTQEELVIAGEMSGDEKFYAAYGPGNHEDLHAQAAVAVLRAVTKHPDIVLEDFKALKQGKNTIGVPLFDPEGNELEPKAAAKVYRGTLGGKGLAFEWLYSGFTSNLAKRWGLGIEGAQALTEAYAEQFPQLAQWRAELLGQAQQTGYVQLPDGHRRVRFEATNQWQMVMKAFWSSTGSEAIKHFGDLCTKKICRRACNQMGNAIIQGTGATILKRSVNRLRKELMPFVDASIRLPIHDELVFSVAYDAVEDFIPRAKAIMCDHPSIINKLVLSASASVGNTLQPYDSEKCKFGQIEIDEAPALPWIKNVGGAMDQEELKATLEYLKQAA